MLVTTPIWVGILMKVPSDSSASTIIHVAVAEPRVGAPVVDDAAGDHGRVEAGHVEDVGDQRGGRGLAVRAGDRDRRIEPHQLGQHLGAADDGQALGARRLQLGVAGLHGGGDDDVARADEIDRIVADEHADALGAQAPHVGAVLLVAALHRIALGVQDLGDGAHADAADADDVEGADITEAFAWLSFPRWRRVAAATPQASRFSAGGLSAPRPDRRGARPRPAGPRLGRSCRLASVSGACQQSADAAGQALRRSDPSARCTKRRPIRRAGCVLQLIVVEGMRQRHQDRGPAHDRKLGHGGGAGAADDQMGLGHVSGRLAKKVARCARTPRPDRPLDALQVLLAALLHHEQAGADLLGQQRQRRRHGVGEKARALAAAEHQQRERAAGPGADSSAWPSRPPIAHRIAGEPRLAARRLRDTWCPRTRWR